MDRGGRASEMVDLVDFEEKRLNDVVSDELEPGVPEMVHYVLFPAGEEIVHNDHAVPSLYQTVHKVRPDKSGPTRHHDPEPLSLQPQRHLPTRIPVRQPEPALVSGLVRQMGRRIEVVPNILVRDRDVAVNIRRARGREEREPDGGYSNADEDEDEALLSEQVPNRAGHRGPWLLRFRRVGVRHVLGLVPSEDELRTHCAAPYGFRRRVSWRLLSNLYREEGN